MGLGTSYGRLCELAALKKELMELYLVQVRQQGDLVAAKNMEGLFSVLEEKEKLIAGIDAIDRESQEVEHLLDYDDTSSGDIQKEELTRIRGAIRQLAAQAREIEEKQSQCLQQASRKLRLKLDQLGQGRQTMAVYAPMVRQTGGVFIDRKE